MKELDKLRVLLSHWVEHNIGHEVEWLKWVETARQIGKDDIAENIEAAAAKMGEVNALLNNALDQAGGPATEQEHSHH